jgi:phage terminase large subunit-like protein
MPKADKPYFYRSECRSEATLRKLHAGAESGVTFEQWLDLRDKARKNLFWLGVAVLKKDWLPHRHQVICDFFVQKNFDGIYYEGYSLGDVRRGIGRQDECKERMLLWPRGSYKSDIDGVDCLQWMLNAPDIRIFVLSAKEDNALKFLHQIKKYFYKPDDAPLTQLQRLFPEYILTGKDGYSDTPLETPARVLKAEVEEPTLWVDAVISTLASKHCDIKKGDDVVSDRNSQTEEARVKLKNKYDNVANLLDEWGYEDHIGTRYAEDDWYGTRLAVQNDAPLKYMCAAAWTVKPEFKDVKLRQIQEHMVDLLFPEKLTFKSLRAKLLKNEVDFRCQQLNEPAGGEVSLNFDIETLRAHECQPSRVPQTGNIYIMWDWALTSGKYSDYSAAVVVKIGPDNDAWVLEVVCDKFKSSELAYQIVALNKKWKPLQTIIEKSNGSELLQLELLRQANKYRLPLNNIHWRQPSNEKDAKRNRFKSVETLLTADRLYFVAGPWIDLTFSQLVDCTGNTRKQKRKDDIPDALGYLALIMPPEKKKDEKPEPSSDADRNAAMKKAMLEQWQQQQANPELFFNADAIDALRANQTSGLELLNPSVKPELPRAVAPGNRMSRIFKRAS